MYNDQKMNVVFSNQFKSWVIGKVCLNDRLMYMMTKLMSISQRRLENEFNLLTLRTWAPSTNLV